MSVPKAKPIVNAQSITPSDVTVYNPSVRGLYVGVTGDVAVVDPTGNTVTYQNLAAGQYHPIEFVQIKATGTTATGIVGGN